MIIYFVALEPDEQGFYGDRFPGHELIAVPCIGEVDSDAEIVSIFINDQVDDVFLSQHPNLKLICTRSTSTDHIDLAACRARGVLVCHVPFYGETAVAEHTFGLMLALARRMRKWMTEPQEGDFNYESVRSVELMGKTLGLIGMGRIGQRVAELARAFHMRVLACDIERPEGLDKKLGFEWVTLEELLPASDVISLHATLSPEMYHVINAGSLAKMKRGVFIINTARGALIDTAALRDALESGHVGGAGLDVLEDERVLRRTAPAIISADIVRHLRSDALAQEADDAERIRSLRELMLGQALLSRSDVVFTPHVAFNSEEATQRLRQITAMNLVAFLAGSPQNLVAPHVK